MYSKPMHACLRDTYIPTLRKKIARHAEAVWKLRQGGDLAQEMEAEHPQRGQGGRMGYQAVSHDAEVLLEAPSMRVTSWGDGATG